MIIFRFVRLLACYLKIRLKVLQKSRLFIQIQIIIAEMQIKLMIKKQNLAKNQKLKNRMI